MIGRHHIASRVFGVPLMITGDKLQAILAAIWPASSGDGGLPALRTMDQEDEREASGQGGRGPYRVTPEGIAVLPILDTLVRRGSWVDAMSGLTSYESIRRNLRSAVADPGVRGILLDVDSPGGEAGGVLDLSDEIRAARGRKPIWAIANECACSAAYAIASAADSLWVPRTGQVGSIGVMALFRDQSGQDQAEGLSYTAVYAGARKNDFNPHEPLTDAARLVLQGEVDRHYSLFVDTVARNRRLGAEAVRATEAGILNSEQALTAKLADRIGTFDDALAAMAARVRPRLAYGAQASSAATAPDGSAMSMDADQPGAPSGDRQENVVDLEAARREAHSQGEAAAGAYAAEVADLCALAGLPQMAGELIKAKPPIAEVRSRLQAAQRAVTASNPVDNRHHAGGDAPKRATLDPVRIYDTRARAMGQR
jgi:signal peptide peptidase SppA